MGRSGYTDDEDVPGQFAMWRGTVASAIRGRRGQKMLKDMLAALDAMPHKRLIKGHLEVDGEVCALGALGKYRGVDMSHCEALIDRDGNVDDELSLAERLASTFDIASQLAQEVQFMNDEWFDFAWVDNKRHNYTPEERWKKMREWVVSHLKEHDKPTNDGVGGTDRTSHGGNT